MAGGDMGLDPALVELPPGPAWCRAWTGHVDDALRSWLAEAGSSEGISIVALGSYARRQLCPGSDIDLLLLHDRRGPRELEDLVRALCYPLWDAGLTVGYAVRTVAECVRAAGEHLDTATALTDHRLVAGDPGPLDGLTTQVRRWLRRNSAQVLAEVGRSDDDRRRLAGERPGALEPDLRDGAGGLRDIDSLRWAAACVLGEADLDTLVGARYLGASERRQLAQAADVLLTARVALHLVQGSPPHNVLRLDLQDDVAGRAGTGDADVLLRAVGLAMRAVAHLHGRTWGRLLADARSGRRRRVSSAVVGDDLRVVDGLLEVDASAALDADPSLGMRAVSAAAQRGISFSRSTAERLGRQVAQAPGLPWDASTREAFLAVLAAGADAEPALADADHVGLLTAYLPEWSAVRGRPQRNPWHTYDLDTHAIRAVAELRRIAAGAIDPGHVEVWARLRQPTVALLATFLHDIGKAYPGDHSETGAAAARRWLTHMGFDDETGERVATLVRLHLLLPDTATRRDLEDPSAIAEVTDRVGDPQLLDALYLLSLADSRATGPAAHSPWKDGLMATLHQRARAHLLRRGAAPSPLVGPTPDPARHEEAAPLRALLAGLPGRYLRTASPAQCAEHARLVMQLRQDEGIQASWSSGPAPGTSTLSVVAVDRRGLVADCAGVLAAHGAIVLEARAFTWEPPEGGPAVALDWFDVAPPGDLDQAAVEDDLRAAERGDLDIDEAVSARARRRGAPRSPQAQIATRVVVEEGPEGWRIEVHCPDQPGVLSRLARVIADEGLEISGARIATLGPAASDVFFVRPPLEEVDVEGLRRRLIAAESD